MPKRVDISDSDSDVLVMDSPPPRPRSSSSADDDEDDPLDSFSPPPQPAAASAPAASKGKGKARNVIVTKSASSTPRAGQAGSSSKATPQSAVRRLPPPQPVHHRATPASAVSSSGRYQSVAADSEGESEYSPVKPSTSKAGAAAAGATSSAGRTVPKAAAGRASSQASSSKKPSSTASSSAATGRSASGKGKQAAGKAKAQPKPPAPKPPKPPPAPKPKARPGWKGYAEPGTVVEPPVPSKGYLSGLDMLWQQGMFDPFQDGEPLKKSLRSGRQVRNPSARWGDDEPEETDEHEHAEQQQDPAASDRHENDHGSVVPNDGGHDYTDADANTVAELSRRAQQATADDDDHMEVESADYAGGMTFEPDEQTIISPPPASVRPETVAASAASVPAVPAAVPPPAPKPPAGPPPQNFRKISSVIPSHVTSSLTPAAKSDPAIGRLTTQLSQESSPFQVPARPLSPPLANGRKRAAPDGEALPLKKLRSTLPPPPGASPRPSRSTLNPPATDMEAAAADEDEGDDDVADLSFYPQIQVDFDAEPTPADELSSHRELATGDLVHLTQTKSLVLAQLSGHAPPLPPAKSAIDENAESVQTLTELLRGTAEKGEGNSCLIQGVRGSGKSTVLHRALSNIETSTTEAYEAPHIIRLSALVQKDDKAAIREIGRQFGVQDQDEPAAKGEAGEGEATLAPATLPAHLLAILTAPSKKAIVIVLEEFDVFASFGRGGRQMLLYCLLDVVQSIRPSLEGLSGRGVAVVGVTSRLDTLHLLEKRVKSRFSHRIIRVSSAFHGDRSHLVAPNRPSSATIAGAGGGTSPSSATIAGAGGGTSSGADENGHDEPPRWLAVLSQALVPWQPWQETGPDGEGDWRGAWRESVEHLLSNPTIQTGLERLTWLTTDVRSLLKVFVLPVIRLTNEQPFLTPAAIQRALTDQAQGAGWGKDMRKFKTLSLPCLSVLAAVKDLGERGIHEFNFEHVFFTYGEFAKARLVGTGKARFGRLVMKDAFNQLAQTAVLFPCQSSTSASAQSFSTSAADYAKHRCAVSPYDIVELFRGPAGKGILSQLSAWGRKFDI